MQAVRAVQAIRFGSNALLVEVPDAKAALDLALWARGRVVADEVVPAARTVLFDGVPDPDRLLQALAGWEPGLALEDELPGHGPEVEVEVDYDGPDLPLVGQAWGLTADEVVSRHTAVEHVVAFCGFAPGFPYLTSTLGLPDIPRRSSPRTHVPSGSVGLAGPFTGIYPGASPGGWQLIGRTDAVLWDQSRSQPALLPPGTRVRFRQR